MFKLTGNQPSMVLRRILILCFSLVSILGAQALDREQPPVPDGVYIDLIVLPSGTTGTVTIMYRVENKSLIFLKENEYLFRASFRISAELKNTSTGAIQRASDEKVIAEQNYDNTLSAGRTSQGFVTIGADTGKYSIFVTCQDLNANKEMRFPQLQLNIHKFEVCEPIPVVINTEGIMYPVNYGGVIPFNQQKYSLLVTTASGAASDAILKLNSPFDTLSFVSTKMFKGVPAFLTAGGQPEIKFDSSSHFVTFLFKDISLKLWEEVYKPEVFVSGKVLNKTLFPLPVQWLKKPYSLTQIDEAISLLEIIGKEKEADSLDGLKSERKRRGLYQFWNTLNKPAEGNFNPLMAEFYTRADYAIKSFSSFKGMDGDNTDRGKTYIRFGKPDKTERGVSREGKITELWVYEKAGRSFLFVDYSGNGNYQLKEQK